MAEVKEPRKDKHYYERRRQVGIQNVTAKRHHIRDLELLSV